MQPSIFYVILFADPVRTQIPGGESKKLASKKNKTFISNNFEIGEEVSQSILNVQTGLENDRDDLNGSSQPNSSQSSQPRSSDSIQSSQGNDIEEEETENRGEKEKGIQPFQVQ